MPHLGDWRSAVLPWKAGRARVSVADTAFSGRRQELRIAARSSSRAPSAARDAVAVARAGGDRRRQRAVGPPACRRGAARRARALLDRDAERRLGALRVRSDGHPVHLHRRPEARQPGRARPVRRRGVPARERAGDDDRERPAAWSGRRSRGRRRRSRRISASGTRPTTCARAWGSRPGGAPALRRARRAAGRGGQQRARTDRLRARADGERRADAASCWRGAACTAHSS